jgi:hypothetical protein
MGEVVGRPDRRRSEPGAGAVRGPAVERRAQDDDVGVRERAGVAQVAPVDAEEGDVGSVLGAIAGHAADPISQRSTGQRMQ